jgi:transcriptional regulator with XRE-family HTH domain
MHQLSNYLLANRKSLGLSQQEVGILLGTQNGAKVCRYERYARVPSLETALAFEAIFQKPASELFGGLYQKVQQEITERAKTLILRDERKPNKKTAQRRQILAKIASKSFN